MFRTYDHSQAYIIKQTQQHSLIYEYTTGFQTRKSIYLMKLIYSYYIWKKTEINGPGDSLCWPRDTLYPLKLALTSLKNGGRSVGIVRLRTKTTELLMMVLTYYRVTQVTLKFYCHVAHYVVMPAIEVYIGKQDWKLKFIVFTSYKPISSGFCFSPP
jgi:hypothetical protein